MYICKFCNSEFDLKYKLARHSQTCINNPNNKKVECSFCHKFFYPSRLKFHQNTCYAKLGSQEPQHQGKNWAKGLTKATDSRILKQSESLKDFYSVNHNAFFGKKHTEETKLKISNSMLNYNHANNVRNLHSKGGWYDGIYFMSTWELAYYIYMIDNGYTVNRCTDRFKYSYLDKNHFYTPDFIVNKVYIEIKGREVERDLVKYASVVNSGKSIQVLYEKDLTLMINYVKNKYNIKNITELYSVVS